MQSGHYNGPLLPPSSYLTPCRALTLIKQVVPVAVHSDWPTALEVSEGGGALYNTFFSEHTPLFPELACRYFARQLSRVPWPRPNGNSSKFKDPAGTLGGRRCAPGWQGCSNARAQAPGVSMRAFSNFPCSCCSGAASIDVEQLWQTQSTAGVPT